MKKNLVFLLFFGSITRVFCVQIDDLKKNVVSLEVILERAAIQTSVSGKGFVFSTNNNVIFILTASHVLFPPQPDEVDHYTLNIKDLNGALISSNTIFDVKRNAFTANPSYQVSEITEGRYPKLSFDKCTDIAILKAEVKNVDFLNSLTIKEIDFIEPYFFCTKKLDHFNERRHFWFKSENSQVRAKILDTPYYQRGETQYSLTGIAVDATSASQVRKGDSGSVVLINTEACSSFLIIGVISAIPGKVESSNDVYITSIFPLEPILRNDLFINTLDSHSSIRKCYMSYNYWSRVNRNQDRETNLKALEGEIPSWNEIQKCIWPDFHLVADCVINGIYSRELTNFKIDNQLRIVESIYQDRSLLTQSIKETLSDSDVKKAENVGAVLLKIKDMNIDGSQNEISAELKKMQVNKDLKKQVLKIFNKE